MNTKLMLCALSAASATTSLSPHATAQPLGQSSLFVYVLEDFTHCYQVDPLRNYRVQVSIENCMQPDPGLPDPLDTTGWVFVSQDDNISPVAEITTVYGLNGDPGDIEPTLAGLNPSDPEYSHLADEKITTREGLESFLSETAMVQNIQLPSCPTCSRTTTCRWWTFPTRSASSASSRPIARSARSTSLARPT